MNATINFKAIGCLFFKLLYQHISHYLRQKFIHLHRELLSLISFPLETCPGKKISPAPWSQSQSERRPPPHRPKGTCPRVLSQRCWPGAQYHLSGGIQDSPLNFQLQCPSLLISLLFASIFICSSHNKYCCVLNKTVVLVIVGLVCVQRLTSLLADRSAVCWPQLIATCKYQLAALQDSLQTLNAFNCDVCFKLWWLFFSPIRLQYNRQTHVPFSPNRQLSWQPYNTNKQNASKLFSACASLTSVKIQHQCITIQN